MATLSVPNPLYAIADTLDQPDLSFQTLTQHLCTGGVRLLQLRVKQHSIQDFLSLAKEVQQICQQHGCLIIINDRVDIARAIDADGVHVGQGDMPLAAARKVLGREKIIGVSTHDPQQALAAAQGGADYIGFGPLFGTTTKATGYTPRGLDQLRQVRRLVSLPIIAIGGITPARAPSALEAGADAVAMISDIVLAPNIQHRVEAILQRLKPYT